MGGVRFRAFTEVQSQERDRLQHQVPGHAQVQKESTIDSWRSSRAWSLRAFPGASGSLRKVLELTRSVRAEYCQVLDGSQASIVPADAGRRRALASPQEADLQVQIWCMGAGFCLGNQCLGLVLGNRGPLHLHCRYHGAAGGAVEVEMG